MAVTITTQAIVLRSIPYLEHHRILTLFSPERGLITVTAHGALGAKSKLRACSVPFASGEFVLSGTGSHASVSAFSPDAQYYGAMTDYDIIVHASVLGAFCLSVVQPDQHCEGLYALLLEALAYLNYGDIPARTVLCMYLTKMLDETGFAPDMEKCMHCGAQKGQPMLDFFSGGLCCKRCRPNASPLPQAGPRFIRQLRAGGLIALEPGAAALLAQALVDYAQQAIGQELKAAQLLVKV